VPIERWDSLTDCYVIQNNGKKAIAVTGGGQALDVAIQCQFTQSIDLYAHIDKAFPQITVDTAIDDRSITVNSVADIIAGDIIIILEKERIFQSIVLSVSENTINFASPLDYAFTTNGEIHTGTRNIAVDGSSTPQVAHVEVPPLVSWDICRIAGHITDDTAMDSAKFGGISALTNGIVLRLAKENIKNLMLIESNIGFAEQGFTLEYDAKAPAGVYGFIASKNNHVINGISLRLSGPDNDQLQCIIQDDLTDLTSFSIVVNGHAVRE